MEKYHYIVLAFMLMGNKIKRRSEGRMDGEEGGLAAFGNANN